MSDEREDPSEPVEGVDGPPTRREILARLGLAGLVVGGVGTGGLRSLRHGSASASAAVTAGRSQAGTAEKPNVLLIVADDMRYDQLRFMPNVKKLIEAHGRSFTQARCNVPLCQPSRVGLMTGQMSKHNNEIGIGYTGSELRDHNNTIGKWMSDAGYRCGFFGKYINFWDGFGGINAPAGWDTWRELTGETNAYWFRVHLNEGAKTIKGVYSSDYVAEEARKWLKVKDDRPFFCVATPTQPHTPFRPRRDLAHKFSHYKVPLVDEVDVSDKPAWIQALRPLTKADKAQLRKDAIGSNRELAAVDDMARQIITSIHPDVLRNTVIIFTSDNGVHRGEHRRRGSGTKAGPYEVGLHVPLLISGPGFKHGPAISAPVLLTQDIAATILDVGGATAGLPNQDGISLVAVQTKPSAYKERVLLHEIGQGFENQTGDGITTGPHSSRGFRKLYRYPSVRVSPNGPYVYEAYDLDTDPNEFSSWANDPARRAERDALEAELIALRSA
jgi:N-acetylglucosamine-6-sulfatase